MRIALIILLGMMLASCSSGAGDRPVSVLVVEWTYATPPLRAVEITDAAQIAKLESFFPNYHARPTSNIAAGWIMKYEVYFNFQRGETVRVYLPDDGKLWTCGKGDFESKGDIRGFLAANKPMP